MTPYAYERLEAASYDWLDELAAFDDFPLYRWLAEIHGGPVLDVACGTGRIALPLAADGFEVVGLDASPAMLEQAEAKARSQEIVIDALQADMRRFELPRRFRLAIVPGFSLQLLADTREVAACIACCRRSLLPGGALVLSHFIPLEMLESKASQSQWKLRNRAKIPNTSHTWIAWQRWRLARSAKRLSLDNRYERRDRRGRVLERQAARMALRWYAPKTLERLLRQAGFDEVETYGDFLLQPPGPDTEATAVVGRTPESRLTGDADASGRL